MFPIPRSLAALATFALILSLVACGGGQTEVASSPPPVEKTCDNTVPAGTGADDPTCGDVLVEVTDADGDFLAYEVDVTSLTLTRADGAIVEVLPTRTRVDFAQLVELTELLTAARVPQGAYTAATLTLDYAAANIVVEAAGAGVVAEMHLPPGRTDQQAQVTVALSADRPLVVAPGTPALLTLDFDLAASHTVVLGTVPPKVNLNQAVLFATLDRNLDDRDHRVRGPMLGADAATATYLIAVRPVFRQDGHFGRLPVRTTDTTEFEVDGVSQVGAAGFAALAAKGPGTATVALGRFDPTLRAYVAARVHAGSSVPGGTLDGAVGAVRARSGDTLTIHGGTLVRATGTAAFAASIAVTLDANTTVRVAGRSGPATLAAISVGSRVEVLGIATEATDGAVSIAAQAVRVVPSTLTATVVGLAGGTLTADLQSIDRRRVSLFGFAGTGTDAAHDADPDAYEIALGVLQGGSLAAGDPIAVQGFVTDFGQAPADFSARTLVDYSTARAELMVGWGEAGTLAPFSMLNNGGIEVDLGNAGLGALHHLKRGPVATDLAALGATLRVVVGEEPLAYAVRRDGAVRVHGSFAEFVAAVQTALAAGDPLHGFFARGAYDEQHATLAAQQMVAVFD
jgi:hypothetical protein